MIENSFQQTEPSLSSSSFRAEFSRASLKSDGTVSDAKIILKSEETV